MAASRYPSFALMILLIVNVLLSACSQSGGRYNDPHMTEILETEILSNGSKMFVYRLRWPEDAVPDHVRVVRTANEPRPYDQSGITVDHRSYRRLQDNTARAVAQLGYCRTGYLELDGSVSRYHLWLKGECREDATEEDKKHFGGRHLLPVKSRP